MNRIIHYTKKYGTKTLCGLKDNYTANNSRVSCKRCLRILREITTNEQAKND